VIAIVGMLILIADMLIAIAGMMSAIAGSSLTFNLCSRIIHQAMNHLAASCEVSL
jgi:hypothetical protein